MIKRFYVMIVNSEKLKSSILILDNELQLNIHEDFSDIRITQVVNDPYDEGNVFALDHELNLVKID